MTTEETATKDDEHMIYLDNLGRLLMGKKLIDQCTDNTVVIKNPVIIDIRSTNQGGINIQFFPVMFREFQADKNEGSVWEYPRTSVVPSQAISIDARLIGQYEQIFAPIQNVQPVAGGTAPVQPAGTPMPAGASAPAPVVKLFDD